MKNKILGRKLQIRELKMNDPKLNKIFDKLKKGNTVKLNEVLPWKRERFYRIS